MTHKPVKALIFSIEQKIQVYTNTLPKCFP